MNFLFNPVCIPNFLPVVFPDTGICQARVAGEHPEDPDPTTGAAATGSYSPQILIIFAAS